MTKTNLREIVLGILLEISKEGVPSHVALHQTLTKYQYLDKNERAFITRLTQGTLEYQLQLDYVINNFSKIKVNKMKPVIRTILRMGVYQLMYMDSVPDSAACNEAVALAEKKGFRSLKGFVNGVLRSIARGKDTLTFPDETKQPLEALSVKYAMPQWIIQMWLKHYDLPRVKAMVQASVAVSETALRVNTQKTSLEELKKSLEAQGVTVKPGNLWPFALRISGYDYLGDLDSFNDGAFIIQDESTMTTVAVADIKSEDVVIDVCAAPGGKSIHAAALTNGTVYARDLTPYKVELIQENIQRLDLKNVVPQVWDATILNKEDIQKADVVIADLPCSGLGVMGRKADIKYNMTPEAIKSLAKLQQQMLGVIWQYVKPGGRLIYSTCTVSALENEDNRAWFLENFPFEPVDLDALLPELLHSETTKEGYLQILPGAYETDGFFVAGFQRKKEGNHV